MFTAAACSSGNDDKRVAATETTRRSSTTLDDSTTASSESSTSTSSGVTSTTKKGAAGTPATTVAPAPVTTGAPSNVIDTIASRKVVTLDQPLAFAQRVNDNSVFIGEKTGKVKRLEVEGNNLVVKATILDIGDRITNPVGGEQGLLGIAFSPDGSKLYVDYTDNPNGATHVAEYPYAGGVANKAAERTVLLIGQPYANHNGGHITFGPDNMLYVALGDGGSGGDPQGNGQNLNVLLGKILRINPNPSGTAPYSIPGDNPFVNQAGRRGEIWHYGLRNPWRFSFDRATGEQWIGDVGQNAYEEIDHVAAGAKGLNFGWNRREGAHAYNGGAAKTGDVNPVFELAAANGNHAIVGGYVYRGSELRGWNGNYLFTDSAKGVLYAGAGNTFKQLGVSWSSPVAFGEDHAGELYVLTLGGPVYKLVRG